jgi:uncharacterized membrane protein (UPF0127 family)
MVPVLRALAALLLVAACAPMRPAAGAPVTAGSAPSVIPLTSPAGRTFEAELMIRPEDRAMGLMFRPSLPAGRVLLFVFDRPDFQSIWMKNCRFPIDIVWLDEARKVVHVAEKVPPCAADPCPSYSPMRTALYVIEMNAGQARREKYAVGAPVSFTLPR